MFIDIFNEKHDNIIHEPCHFCGNTHGNYIEITSQQKHKSQSITVCYECAQKHFGFFYHIYQYNIKNKKNKALILNLQVCHSTRTMIFKHKFFNFNMKTIFAGLGINYLFSDIEDHYLGCAGYTYDCMTIPSEKEFFKKYNFIKKRIDTNPKTLINCHDFLSHTGYENMMSSLNSFNTFKKFGF